MSPATQVCPLVLVRRPCLPLATLGPDETAALRQHEKTTQAELEAWRRWGRQLAEQVGEALVLRSPGARRDLLSLRRDLYNARLGSSRAEVVRELETDLAASIEAWRTRGQQVREGALASQRLWEEALRRTHASLDELVGSSPLGSAVADDQPLLTRTSTSLRGGRARLDSRHRMLAALRWRSTLRPTPLGLYAGTAVTQWTEEQDHTTSTDLAGPARLWGDSGDSYLSLPDLPIGPWAAFLDDVCWYGSAVVAARPSPERAALAAILRSEGAPSSLSLRSCLQLLGRVAAEPAHAVHGCQPSVIARARGLPPARDVDLGLELDLASAVGVPLFSGRQVPTGCTSSTVPERAVLRWVATDPGGAGRVTFWGGPAMSLTTRYLRAGVDDHVAAGYGAWLARWDASLDVDSSPIGGEPLPGPRADEQMTLAAHRLDEGSLDDVLVVASSAFDDIDLVHRVSGHPIHPLTFALAPVDRLVGPAQLLLHLAPRRRSVIHVVLEHLNRRLQRTASAAARPLRLPATWLTPHVQLAPVMTVVVSESVPVPIGSMVDRAGFLAFHRWADRIGLPHGIVAVRDLSGAVDAQPLDLADPYGVELLRRRLGRSRVLILEHLEADATVQSPYRIEMVGEVARRPVPTADRRPSAELAQVYRVRTVDTVAGAD